MSDEINERRYWAVADIDYVRQRLRENATASEIAKDLKEPVSRVRALMYRLGKADRIKDAQGNGFERGRSHAKGCGAISPRVSHGNAAEGPQIAPVDLKAFVLGNSAREASRALRISLGTVHRLRHDYWPEDPRRILRAWAAYKSRKGRIASWFLRRVREGGCIHHAGRAWSAPGLDGHVGELVAVAKSAQGLLVQTLELPALRLTLEATP